MPATPVFAQPPPPPPAQVPAAPAPVVEPAPAPPAKALAVPAAPVTPKRGAKVAPPPAPVAARAAVAPAAAAASARLPPAEGPISWPSMARAKEARALPASSPMTTELEPLPAPAGYGRPPDTEADRQQAALALSEPAPAPAAAVVAPPPPAPTKPAGPVSSHGSPRKAGPAKREVKSAAVAAPRTATAAPTRRAEPVAKQPAVAAPTFEAPPMVEGAATEAPPKDQGEWSYDVDKTGLAIGFDQKLESDSVRQAWAEKGGTLSGSEYTAGVSFLSLEKDGISMSGIGFQGGMRLNSLSMKPPDYEKRDTSWTAWKFGVGADFSVFKVTTDITFSPCLPAAYGGCGMTTESSMSQISLVGTLGFLTAKGSFDSETEWSGFAIGLDWAPAFVMTKDSEATEATTKFNATGFAINFESGSMKAMAETMGKEAHFKLRIFLLPPVGDMPFFVSISVGQVTY